MKSDYSEQSFWQKVWDVFAIAGREVIEKALLLYYAAKNPATPTWAKTTVYGALAYLISPIDVIPDVIPVVGFSDDLTVLAAAVVTVAMYITPDVVAQATRKMSEIFGTRSGRDFDSQKDAA